MVGLKHLHGVQAAVGQHIGDRGLELGLLPEIHELVNAANRAEIKQAVERKLGLSLSLELAAQQSLSAETPQQVKTRRLEQEKQEAIVAIRQDSTVKKLQHAFAAELDEASVVKAETNA